MGPDTVTVGMVTEGIKALGGLGLLVWILLKQTKLDTQMKNFAAVGDMVVGHDRALVGVKKDVDRNTRDINAAHEKYRELSKPLSKR